METKKRKAEIWIKWVMFTAAITGMAILAGFYPVQGNVPLIVIPSILVLLFSKPVFFERLKLTTLLVMRILIVAAALRLFNPKPPSPTCCATSATGMRCPALRWRWA